VIRDQDYDELLEVAHLLAHTSNRLTSPLSLLERELGLQ
jgi:hypothetical protein